MQQSELHQQNNLEKRIGAIAKDWFVNHDENNNNKPFLSWKKGDTIFIKPNYIAPLGGPIVRSFITTKNNKTQLTTTSSVLGKIYAAILLVVYTIATIYMFFTYSGTPEFSISMLVMLLFGIVMMVGIVIASILSIRSQHDLLKYELNRES